MHFKTSAQLEPMMKNGTVSPGQTRQPMGRTQAPPPRGHTHRETPFMTASTPDQQAKDSPLMDEAVSNQLVHRHQSGTEYRLKHKQQNYNNIFRRYRKLCLCPWGREIFLTKNDGS